MPDHSLKMFRYNSYHKAIAGALIAVWAVWHFAMRQKGEGNYPNGQAISSGGTMENFNHGQWAWYYPNGRVKLTGRFERGKRVGPWVTLSESGDTISVATYSDDRLNGPYHVYGPEGRTVATTHYRDDIPLQAQP